MALAVSRGIEPELAEIHKEFMDRAQHKPVTSYRKWRLGRLNIFRAKTTKNENQPPRSASDGSEGDTSTNSFKFELLVE
jgi:hypothetical protein